MEPLRLIGRIIIRSVENLESIDTPYFMTLESLLFVLLLSLAFALPKDLIKQVEQVVISIARYRRRPAIIIAAAVVMGCLVIGSLYPSYPIVSDEFSYELAADTFASGRLTNAELPSRQHFENINIIQEPSYASKYPPAQGLVLAFGKVLGGKSIYGVWLSSLALCLCMFWMLQAWLPRKWAWIGALLTVLKFSLLSYWSQSYWGGNVAAIGGALLFGVIPRIQRHPWLVGNSMILALALLVLSLSRPLEGLIISIPCAFWLVMIWWKQGKHNWQPALVKGMLPFALVLIGGISLSLLYNAAVTGNPLLMPYMLHERTYSATPLFLFQELTTGKAYTNEFLARFFDQISLRSFLFQQDHFIASAAAKGSILAVFFLGPVLGLGFVLSALHLKRRGTLFVLATLGLLFMVMSIVVWIKPHYAAPALPLVVVAAVSGLRILQAILFSQFRMRHGVIFAALLSVSGIVGVRLMNYRWSERGIGTRQARDLKIKNLIAKDGKHLVFVVREEKFPPHLDWVYNTANINQQNIIWVRNKDEEANRKLRELYPDRQPWLLYTDNFEVRIERYR